MKVTQPLSLPLISTVVLVLGVVGFAISQNSPKATSSKTKPEGSNWVMPILGKSRADVEKVLGKPKKVDGDSAFLEAVYERKGLRSVSVAYARGKMNVMEIEFLAEPRDWRSALNTLNIPASGVTAKPGRPGVFDLKGLKGLPAKWEATYFSVQTVDDGESKTTTPAKLSISSPDAT
ncbi:MAG: hypothetical protein JST35_12595 [Armatimonadetes bacterium]|nr:hypothetical protein [Armatimonadota bacterium]